MYKVTKIFSCHHCGRTMTSRQGLVNHIRIHTGEKPYKCSHCGKCFNVKGNLVVHIRTHTGERPFQCTSCDRSFSRSTLLALHIRTSHNRIIKHSFLDSIMSLYSQNLLKWDINRKEEKCQEMSREVFNILNSTNLDILRDTSTHSFSCVAKPCSRSLCVMFKDMLRHIEVAQHPCLVLLQYNLISMFDKSLTRLDVINVTDMQTTILPSRQIYIDEENCDEMASNFLSTLTLFNQWVDLRYHLLMEFGHSKFCEATACSTFCNTIRAALRHIIESKSSHLCLVGLVYSSISRQYDFFMKSFFPSIVGPVGGVAGRI